MRTPPSTRLRGIVATSVMLAALLVGCADAPDTTPMPTIDWQPLEVTTTAVEPFEFRGYLRVAWGPSAFALEAEMEPDLATKTLRVGQAVYTTILERGWTQYTLEEAVGGEISNRLLLWDLRALVESPTMTWTSEPTPDGARLTGHGTILHAGKARNVNATLDLEDDRIVAGTVASPWGRESPFTFAPATTPPGIALATPEPIQPLASVQANDPVARDGHSAIVLMLIDHAEARGTVPDTVDRDSLALELAVSGQEWPTNPYDGTDVAGAGTGGHFTWTKCGPRDGVYEGYGWDRTLLGYAFGGGCANP